MKYKLGDRVICQVWADEVFIKDVKGIIVYIDEVDYRLNYLVKLDIPELGEEDEQWFSEQDMELEVPIVADGQLELPFEEWHEEMVDDNVNSPSHYTQGKIETKELYKLMLTDEERRGGFKMNVIKYITRYQHKNGVEDLKKAMKYIEFLIELEEGN